MFLRLQGYERPGDLVTALSLLGRPGARPLAGGTAAVGPADRETGLLVDLSGLPLRFLRVEEGAVIVGAMTPLEQLLRAPELFLTCGGVLCRAVERTGPPTMLVRATLGGALARPDRAGELIAALLVLDATVELVRLGTIDRGGGQDEGTGLVRQAVRLADFLGQPRSGALIEQVYIPVAPVAAGMERVARTPRDVPAVAVAATLRVIDGHCFDVRVAATGLHTGPARLRAAESALEGAPTSPEAVELAALAAQAEVDPPSDFRGGSDYRRHLAGVLTRRALASALWPDGRM